MTSSVTIREYDWSMLPNNGFVIVTGRRGTGKSSITKEILYQKRKAFKWGMIMTGTAASAEDYAKYIPDSFIHEGYNEELVKNLVLRQEHDHKLHGRAENVFLILEDVMWEKTNIWKSQYMRRLAMNGRWDNIFVLITMQYPMDFGPELRNQVDVVFSCIEKIPQNRERIFKCFNPCFRTFEEFDHIMGECTTNHEVMVLQVGGTTSQHISDSVFFTKAKLDRTFRMARKEPWWDFHEKHYIPDYYAQQQQDGSEQVAAPRKRNAPPPPHVIKERKEQSRKRKPRAMIIS